MDRTAVCSRVLVWTLALVLPCLLPGQRPAPGGKTIVAITAGGGDVLRGAGGTLAKFIDEGFRVFVIQAGNDEKNSVGLSPADTRLANNAETEEAARALGITEVFNLNNKSGELSQLSSNELRNQMSALIRYYKPQKLFIPDPFIHYEPEWDQFWTARAAEETNYSNSGYFLAELTRMGIGGHGVAETYYYSAHRPYRPGEGGHNDAKFMPIDITRTFARKVEACLKLRTANLAYATHVKRRLELMGRPASLLDAVNDSTTLPLVRALLEELAGTIGNKHGFRYGEEFNYHGSPPGRKSALPPWVTEKAKPLSSRP